MSILKIARMGHPALRKIADPLEEINEDHVRLVQDMIETMEDADGTGLAAPQVFENQRIVVYYVSGARQATGEDDESTDEDDGIPLTVLINPELEPIGTDKNYDWEGCLSVPGLTGLVERWSSIRYHAHGLNGEEIEGQADGFHARVLQHECDHLDGILYPQRMEDLSLLMFMEERRHGIPDQARKLMKLEDESLDQ